MSPYELVSLRRGVDGKVTELLKSGRSTLKRAVVVCWQQSQPRVAEIRMLMPRVKQSSERREKLAA